MDWDSSFWWLYQVAGQVFQTRSMSKQVQLGQFFTNVYQKVTKHTTLFLNLKVETLKFRVLFQPDNPGTYTTVLAWHRGD